MQFSSLGLYHREEIVFSKRKEWCRELLKKDYSPEQITGRCKLDDFSQDYLSLDME